MHEERFTFKDTSGAPPSKPDYWAPTIIPRGAIEREIERLADLSRPENGRRSSLIVHPRSTAPGLGLAPGVDVTINVLKPGEATLPVRRNSNQVEICLRGTGVVDAGLEHIAFDKWDVWNIPSMNTYSHRNTGNDLMVRLSYSNAPLLEKMQIHIVEEDPSDALVPGASDHAALRADESRNKMRYARDTAPNFQITDEGAWLRGYEFLVDIEVVPNKALHWPWKLVEPHVPLRPGTNQRPIMLLYNPATERRNGTTHSFFATIAGQPPNMAPRPMSSGHRHSSVAINYHLSGAGKSVVMGQVFEWQEGDLMLSAPGWAEHSHYPGPKGWAVLTVQDHPLQIGMESLIWQEEMDGPVIALGSAAGVTGFTGPRQRGD